MLSVNDAMVTFALDLRPNRAILAVVDLSGRFLSREKIATDPDPKKTISLIGKRIRALRKENPLKSFKGVGVSFPGRVHPTMQRILLAANMHWHEFDLKKTIEQVSGLQVEIDNDANVCLISELWFGRLQGTKNVVLVAVAEGVGTAILTGGHMYSGYNGLAGEFGHVSVDPAGLLCQCGQKGCWETAASSRAAIRTFNAAAKRRVKDIHELLQLGQKGDSNAVYALTEQARALGRGMRLITATLSPELILVVGDITTVWELCGPIVAQELANSMLAGTPPLLRATGDAELARLSGSAAMLMQRHANYHHSTHETSGLTIKHR
jgi:predicted NBD/HSP70 family sugar kinase